MKKYWVLGVLIVLVGGFCFYWFYYRITKTTAVRIIMKHNPTANAESLKQFGEDYLIARASAFRAKEPKFELNGKTYETETGKISK